MTLSDSKALRLVVLVALYLAQGLPWGFCSVGYVVLMTDAGFSATETGQAMGLAILPWGLKVFWGPLLDAWPPRFGARWGRRRPFIVLAQAGMALTLLALVPLDVKSQLSIVAWIVLVHNVFASMQDVAVDGLAVDVLRDDERGRANAFMWAAKVGGVAIGGGGGALVAKHAGWSALFVVLAVVILAIMALPLLFRERPAGEVVVTTKRPGIFDPATLLRTVKARTTWIAFALTALPPLGYLLMAVAFTRFLRADLQLSDERIAFLTGVVENVAGVAGALVGGLLADRFGPRKAIAGALIAIAAAQVAFGAGTAAWSTYVFVVGFVVVWNAAIGAFNAACNGTLMGMSNPRIGATHFALYMALYNMVYSRASAAGGALVDEHGFATMMAVGGVLILVATPIVLLVDVHRARADYGVDESAA